MADAGDWITTALADVGLDPQIDPERYAYAVYLEHLPANERERRRSEALAMAKTQSGCGLAWERWARKAGVEWPHLYRWYGDRIGTAISANVAEAKKTNAWFDADRFPVRSFPQPGDMVLIGGPGENNSRGGLAAEHVLLVAAIDGSKLLSVDGGQPGIARRTRVMVLSPQGELWLANLPDKDDSEVILDADGRPSKGRRVRGWIDHSKLPYRQQPLPPLQTGGGSSGGGGATAPIDPECPPRECPPIYVVCPSPEQPSPGTKPDDKQPPQPKPSKGSSGSLSGLLRLGILGYLLGILTGQVAESYRRPRPR